MYRRKRTKPKKPIQITSTPISPIPETGVNSDQVNVNKSARKRKSSENESAHNSSRLTIGATTGTTKRGRKLSEDEDLFDISFNASTILAESPIASTSKSRLSTSRVKKSKATLVESPAKSSTNAKIAASKSSKNPSKAGFVQMLKKCGFRLQADDNCNFLDKDQAGFVQLLETQFKKDPTFPANVDQFVEAFKTYITESPDNLSQVMENTMSDDDIERKSVQESLLRLLLNVDCVQPKLWKILFDVLEDLIVEEDDDERTFALVHRMIRQIRCQDRIIQGDVNICDKLMGFISLSNNIETKREVILLMPDLILDDNHEKAATELCDNLTKEQALIPARLDTLANLRLSDDLRSRVVDKVVGIMDKADTLYFQVVLKFLISESKDVESVISGIRRFVDVDPAANFNDGNEGLILATTLKECERPKILITTWVEIIDQSENKEWRSVDLIAMLVFYSFRMDRIKALVLSAFKTHARRGQHAEADIEKSYPAVQAVVQANYLDSLLEIVGILFKSKNLEENYYASFWYCLLFRNMQLVHESQRVLEEVLIHISNGNPSQVSLAMRTLTDAANQNRESIARHSTKIQTLMSNMENWELTQVRQLMDLLFQLHYGPERDSDVLQGTPDQIMIRIKKFLNHSSYSWRSKGIVGMVCAIKHMPDRRAIEEFTKLLDLMDGFSDEAIGLLYDELALVCEDFSGDVEEAVRLETLKSFEDAFVKDVTDDMAGRLRFRLLEESVHIVIPLTRESGLTSNYQVMCSQLRLSHRLIRSADLDINDIAALLAAPVLLPAVHDDDSFLLLGPHEQADVLDSLFHCINLFRELVNGFSHARDFALMVVKRVEQIILMGETLARYLAMAGGDYTPPQCQFYKAVKPPAIKKQTKGKGKGKGKAGKGKAGTNDKRRNINDSLHNLSKKNDDFVRNLAAPPAAKAVNLALYSGFFRELETAVFVLLRQPVTFDLDRPDPEDFDREAPCELTPVVINFLLTNFLGQLESLFLVKNHNPFGRDTVNNNSVNQVDAQKAAKYCTKFVPILIDKLDVMGRYCKDLLEENDGVLDALGMSKEGTANVKRCHTLLLQCTLALISWPGFQSKQNQNMKEDLLKKLVVQPRTAAPVADYVNEAFQQFAAHAPSVLHMSGAVALLKVIQKILTFGPPVSSSKTNVIHKLSYGFLTRGWTNLSGVPESGAAYNAHVEAVFTTFMATLPPGDRILQVTDMIADIAKEALKLVKKDSCLTSFITVSKSNFYVVYRTLCSSLSDVTRLAQTLPEWTALVEALCCMTEIVQHLQTAQNLREYAKISIAFFTVFLNKGMDLFNKNIMRKPNEVQHILKTFQNNSRTVNRWIHDVRSKKNSNLIMYTPTLRKLMERIIMRVKAILLPFPESFSVGILKTRNLAGEEILSQQTEDDDADADADDDDAADQGDDDDITLISDNDDGNQESDNDDASSTRSGSF